MNFTLYNVVLNCSIVRETSNETETLNHQALFSHHASLLPLDGNTTHPTTSTDPPRPMTHVRTVRMCYNSTQRVSYLLPITYTFNTFFFHLYNSSRHILSDFQPESKPNMGPRHLADFREQEYLQSGWLALANFDGSGYLATD